MRTLSVFGLLCAAGWLSSLRYSVDVISVLANYATFSLISEPILSITLWWSPHRRFLIFRYCLFVVFTASLFQLHRLGAVELLSAVTANKLSYLSVFAKQQLLALVSGAVFYQLGALGVFGILLAFSIFLLKYLVSLLSGPITIVLELRTLLGLDRVQPSGSYSLQTLSTATLVFASSLLMATHLVSFTRDNMYHAAEGAFANLAANTRLLRLSRAADPSGPIQFNVTDALSSRGVPGEILARVGVHDFSRYTWVQLLDDLQEAVAPRPTMPRSSDSGNDPISDTLFTLSGLVGWPAVATFFTLNPVALGVLAVGGAASGYAVSCLISATDYLRWNPSGLSDLNLIYGRGPAALSWQAWFLKNLILWSVSVFERRSAPDVAASLQLLVTASYGLAAFNIGAAHFFLTALMCFVGSLCSFVISWLPTADPWMVQFNAVANVSGTGVQLTSWGNILG
jgi:hypothetical protein